MPRFLAFDIGAESGRAVAATLEDCRLRMEEVHRFPNHPVQAAGTLYWDILALYRGVLEGMRAYAARFGGPPDGLGIDTWGVDFGLLAADGSLLQNPVHYRDRRTHGILDEVARRISPAELFRRTGMSPSPIWSACQLLSMRLRRSPVLQSAATLLLIPDLLAYFLTGRKQCERTNAVNTLLYNLGSGSWDDELFEVFGLPRAIAPELAEPGTVAGNLREDVKTEVGWDRGVVFAPCTHDTASAVAAVPARTPGWAFLSCGTWSVLGAPTDRPITCDSALQQGFCNELSYGGLFLCRNIVGLWLLQQARLHWTRGGQDVSYEQLMALAGASEPGGPLIDPQDPAFLAPADMLGAIAGYCRKTNQPAPGDPGAIARCILESLALCYRLHLERLSEHLERRFRVLHVTGGGSRNALLCRFTADATGLPVIAGPAEATAAGNALVQAIAHGSLGSAAEAREVSARSFALTTYEPEEAAYWDDRFARYVRLTQGSRR